MNEQVFQDCLRKWRDGGGNKPIWAELADRHGYSSKEALRSAFKRERKNRGLLNKPTTPTNYKESIEYKEDGSITSDKLIKISEVDAKSPEKVLIAHGFDPKLWDVKYYKHNLWHSMRPEDKGLRVLHQSKLTVAPKKPQITQIDFEKFFETFDTRSREFVYNEPRVIHNNGLTLEITLPDLHLGNNAFDSSGVLRANFCSAVKSKMRDIISKAKKYELNKIYLVPLGDIFHFDTPGKTTTKGTQVDSGFEYTNLFDTVSMLFIDIVNTLSEIAPVEVPYIGGNHDRAMGYFLTKVLEHHYYGHKYVVIDSDPRIRKWRVIGNTLVGWAHGDIIKKNSTNWLQKEARLEFGKCKYAEIHAGHIHHQEVREVDGLILRHLPTIAETDTWHYEKGYVGNVKSLMCFLWGNNGLEETWYFNQ